MTEERPSQMLCGAHSKKIFHSKGKKKTNFVLLGLGYKKLLSPLLVCIKLSSHVGLEASQPACIVIIVESEHKDVKKRAWSNDHYDQRTLSSCGRTKLNVGSM